MIIYGAEYFIAWRDICMGAYLGTHREQIAWRFNCTGYGTVYSTEYIYFGGLDFKIYESLWFDEWW